MLPFDYLIIKGITEEYFREYSVLGDKMYRIILSKENMLQPEEVKSWIINSDKAVKRAAILLYEQQDPEEKAFGCATKVNDRGFNRYDAPFLQGFAEKAIHDWDISANEIIKARYKLIKYAKQIADITNEKADIQLEWDFSKHFKKV